MRVAALGMLGMLWEEGLSVGGLVCSWGQGSDGLGVRGWIERAIGSYRMVVQQGSRWGVGDGVYSLIWVCSMAATTDQ